MRIVGSIATIPSRINNLEPTLISLSNQSRPLDQLYVVIPNFCKKEQCGYTIPPFIHKYARLVTLQDDYGPLNKLIGPIEQENNPETRIITFDDDIIYPTNLVDYLEQQAKARPNVAIGTAGVKIGHFPFYLSFATNYDNASQHWYNFEPHDTGEEVDILVGYAGNMYKRGFFPNTTSELTKHALEEPDIFKNDDILIASWLSREGVKRYVYPGPEMLRRDISYQHGLSNSLYSFVKRAYSAIRICEQRGLLVERVHVKWCWTVTGPIFLLLLLLMIALLVSFL